MEDSERSAAQYDAMAEAYAADNLDSPFNAYYERPATQRLLADVTGKQVLEVGCGAGPLTEWLVERGAVVTAMDISAGMLRLAKARLRGRARAVVGDLAEPLPFDDASFDLVVASLVMHYLHDWVAPLRELRRVLSSAGVLVFSTHYLTMDASLDSPANYFEVKQVTEVWTKGAGSFDVTFWRRPLTAMSEAIHEAGFLIEQLVEPMPDPELRARDADNYRLITTQPRFLFFRLKPDPPRTLPNDTSSADSGVAERRLGAALTWPSSLATDADRLVEWAAPARALARGGRTSYDPLGRAGTSGDWSASMAEGPCTVIVSYEVAHEDAARFVDSWEKANEFLKQQPGFVSTALHKAVSANPDFRFVNVSCWENDDAFRSATQNPDFQAASGRLTPFPIHASAYEVVRT